MLYLEQFYIKVVKECSQGMQILFQDGLSSAFVVLDSTFHFHTSVTITEMFLVNITSNILKL